MNDMVPHENTDGCSVKHRRASRWDCGPKEPKQSSSLELCSRTAGLQSEARKGTHEKARVSERDASNEPAISSKYPELGESTKSSRKETLSYRQQSDHQYGDAVTDLTPQSFDFSNTFGWNGGLQDRVSNHRNRRTNRSSNEHYTNRCDIAGASSRSGRNSDLSRHNLSRRYRGRDDSSTYVSEKSSRHHSGSYGQWNDRGRRDEWYSRGRSESRYYRSENHFKKDWRQVRSFDNHSLAVNRANERQGDIKVQSLLPCADSSRTSTSQNRSRVSSTSLENVEPMHELSNATAEGEYSDKVLAKEGWVYLDNDGILQGPMELAAIKVLHQTGHLKSDHMVEQHMSNEWVTLEHAESPTYSKQPQCHLDIATSQNHSSEIQIVESCLSRHVSHSDASVVENHLGAHVTADPIFLEERFAGAATYFTGRENQAVDACDGRRSPDYPHNDSGAEKGSSYNLVDFHIDERVDRLMQGFILISGREKEIVSEALRSARQMRQDDEVFLHNEDSPDSRGGGFSPFGNPWREGSGCVDALSFEGLGFDINTLNGPITKLPASAVEVPTKGDNEATIPTAATCSNAAPLEHQIDHWQGTLRGGDWKLVYPLESQVDINAGFDKCAGRKAVLNYGKPLCDMLKSGLPDPRKNFLELSAVDPSAARMKVDLPPWVYAMINKTCQTVDRLEHHFLPQQTQAQFVRPRDSTFKSHSLSGKYQDSSKSEPSSHLGNLKSKPAPHASITLLGSGMKTLMETKHLNKRMLNNAIEKGRKVHGDSGNERLCNFKKEIMEVKSCHSQSVFSGTASYIGALVGNRNTIVQQSIENHNVGLDKVNLDSVENFDSTPASGQANFHEQIDGMISLPGNAFVHRSFSSTVNNDDFQHGDWFYLDGTGQEVGPFNFAQLQAKVDDGTLSDGLSVYRKNDAICILLFAQNTVVQNVEAAVVSVLDCEAHDNGSSPGPPGVSREPPSRQNRASLSSTVTDLPQNKWTSDPASFDFPHSLQMRQTISENQSLGNKFCPSMPQSRLTEDLDNRTNYSVCHGHSSDHNISRRSWDVHTVHPSFMAFTRGRLHEFVLRHYKSHLLPATLHECLEGWLLEKKKGEIANVFSSPNTTSQTVLHSTETVHAKVVESERHMQHTTSNHISPSGLSLKLTEETMLRVAPTQLYLVGDVKRNLEATIEIEEEKIKHCRVGKRRRLLHFQDFGADPGLETSIYHDVHAADPSEEAADLKRQLPWGSLQETLLRRIFHCFQGDLKTLACAGAACKSWDKAAHAFRLEMESVDLSFLGVSCSDAALFSLAKTGGSFTRISLRGCTMVSLLALKHLLHERPSITSVDITGCDQFQELMKSFAQVEWFSSSLESKIASGKNVFSLGRDQHKMKSIKTTGEKRRSFGKASDIEVTESASKRAKLEATEDANTPEPMELDSTDMADQGFQFLSNEDSSKEGKVFDNGNPIKSGMESAKLKPVQPKNGSQGYPFHSRGKLHSMPSKPVQKVEGKRIKSTHFLGIEKCISPKVKGETLSRNGAPSPGPADELLEEFASILESVMDVDHNKFFFQMGVSDGKSSKVSSRHMDFLTIEKKLKGGCYFGNWDGFKTFKEDLLLLCRNAFHLNAKRSSRLNAQSSSLAKAAKEIFVTAHRMLAALEKSLSDSLHLENQAQGKVPSTAISAKLRGKSQGSYSPCNSGLKGQSLYGAGDKSKAGTLKKKSKLSSTYSDTESESGFIEKEGRNFTKSRSRYWSDSDTEISDEDLPEDDGEDSEGSRGSGSDGDGFTEEESDYVYKDHTWDVGFREWGARMTKAAMVPPVTRKYEVIENYTVVIDQPEVDRKMTVELPENYTEKLQAAQERKGGEYSHLDIPELKEYRPRKRLGEEVVEQEVYGIEPYTYNLLMDTMPKDASNFNEMQRNQFIEEGLLRTLNKEVSHYTGTGKAPMEYPLIFVVQKMIRDAQRANNPSMYVFCEDLLKNMEKRLKDKYVAYRKGLGVVCNTKEGFRKDDFVVEFLGEVYPAWRWYEKQDAIRSLQKKEKDSAPEFYNIMLERPKGDAGGYDLVVVDAMHKANYASRICHSCRPNCEAKVTAVNGHYTIGVYTLRPVFYGEELTFDYNSVTESKEEWNISICLCGSQGCRGSYLNLTGAGTFEEVMKRNHGLLDRHHMLLEACTDGEITQHELDDMRQAGVGTCMLSGLPNWAIKYTALLVGFINLERTNLPEELMKSNRKREKEFGTDAYYRLERLDAEIQADGVYNNRLQNLAITLDKVRYLLTKLYKEPFKAPPPLRKLETKELVRLIWKGEGSVVGELLDCMALHVPKEQLLNFERKVRFHDPDTKHVQSSLRRSLIWLRDELRSMPATCMCRHDVAADIIHLYACTKYFFTSQDYGTYESPTLFLNSLDLGSRHAYVSNGGAQSWSKSYNKDYVLGQLIYWYKHGAADPGSSLSKARRGCLVLPDVSSCYSKSLQQEFRRGYGSKQRSVMIEHMVERPQKQWPMADFWEFKSNRGLFGSPMLDAIHVGGKLDPEMLDWLRKRSSVFEGPWDGH